MEYIELKGFCFPVEGKVSDDSFMEINDYGRRIKCQSLYISFKDSQKLMEMGGEWGLNYFRLSPNENWKSRRDLVSSLDEKSIQSREMSRLQPPNPDCSPTKEWEQEPGYGPSW